MCAQSHEKTIALKSDIHALKSNMHVAIVSPICTELGRMSGGHSMTLRMETAERFAHRANITKYQKILATYLTAEERRFVERRLAEEQAALRQLSKGVAAVTEPTFAA